MNLKSAQKAYYNLQPPIYPDPSEEDPDEYESSGYEKIQIRDLREGDEVIEVYRNFGIDSEHEVVMDAFWSKKRNCYLVVCKSGETGWTYSIRDSSFGSDMVTFYRKIRNNENK
jgi:hypothetical protein